MISNVSKEAAEQADQEGTARERAKAEEEKYAMQLSSACSLKQSDVANQLIADSLKLPLEIVEKL